MGDRTTWQEDLIPEDEYLTPKDVYGIGARGPAKGRKKDPRTNWPEGLKSFVENYGAFFKLQSVKSYPSGCVAKFSFDVEQGGQYSRPEIATMLSRLGATGEVYRDSIHHRFNWLKVTFPSTGAVFEQNQPQQKKETKKMNEDTEFYLALLQSSGVKMVEVLLDKRSYTYLCAIPVVTGQHVVVQARDQMMVGVVEDVLEEWDMDVIESYADDLKWIINTVDVSNAVLYAEQKKQVFRDLRQSRLVEKAKKFAGNANLDFNSLVTKTQNSLAIEHQPESLAEQIKNDPAD